MQAFLTGLFKRIHNEPPHQRLMSPEHAQRIRILPWKDPRIRVATVDQHDTRHAFLTITASGVGTVREQINETLKTAREICQSEDVACPSVIYQVVFAADIGLLQAYRQEILNFYGEFEVPVTTYVPQTPCDDVPFTMEIMAVDDHAEIVRCSDQLAVERHDGIAWIYGAQIHSEFGPSSAYERSLNTFEKMSDLLDCENAKMSDIVRTWIYQGDIVGPEGETQRYKELNRARTDFFEGTRFIEQFVPEEYEGIVYPASTGIGADDADVVMSVLAIQTERDDVVVVPLENPDQTSAFDYGAVHSPQSPKFARAMAVQVGQAGTVFVSGTASITKAESRYIDDPVGQTHQTIDNIAVLITGDNLERHGIRGLEASPLDMAIVRVYVKRPQDYPAIREICEQRFGPVPTIYTIADVCRPELLVEIEGMAFPRLRNDG